MPTGATIRSTERPPFRVLYGMHRESPQVGEGRITLEPSNKAGLRDVDLDGVVSAGPVGRDVGSFGRLSLARAVRRPRRGRKGDRTCLMITS